MELLLALDKSLSLSLFRSGVHPTFRFLMVAFTLLGSGATLVLLLPFIRREHRWSPTARVLLASCLTSGVLVFVLKLLFARTRPYLAMHLTPWDTHLASVALVHVPTDPSFPSGHAAGAFTVVGVVVPMLWRGGRRNAAALVIASAILIAMSRVVLGAHYLSDVTVGAVLGWTVGTCFEALRSGRHKNRQIL